MHNCSITPSPTKIMLKLNVSIHGKLKYFQLIIKFKIIVKLQFEILDKLSLCCSCVVVLIKKSKNFQTFCSHVTLNHISESLPKFYCINCLNVKICIFTLFFHTMVLQQFGRKLHKLMNNYIVVSLTWTVLFPTSSFLSSPPDFLL